MKCKICRKNKKIAIKYKSEIYCTGFICEQALFNEIVKDGLIQAVEKPLNLYYHKNGEYIGNQWEHTNGEIIQRVIQEEAQNE